MEGGRENRKGSSKYLEQTNVSDESARWQTADSCKYFKGLLK